MKKGDETCKKESGNMKMKTGGAAERREGTGKTFKVGCDMTGGSGRGDGFGEGRGDTR
jgi:hypothetical protein